MKGKIMKFVVGAAVVAPALIASAAFASVNVNNVLFDNGTGNVTTTAGSNVNVHLYANTSGTNDVESIFVTFPGAGGQAEQGVCYNVEDQVGESPVNGWVFNFNVKAPVNAGVWPITFSTHGTNGNDADQGCFTSADSTQTFNGRVTVESSNSGGNPTGNSGGSTTGGTNTNQPPQWFIDWLNSQNGGSTGQTAAMKAKCDLVKPYLMATPYEYSAMGVQLQSALLLDNPYSIPALAAGSTVKQGYFGIQTHAALAAYNSANKCQ